MADMNPLPDDDGEGVTLSPDAPIGKPVPVSGAGESAPQPAPADGGIIGPGDAPGTR